MQHRPKDTEDHEAEFGVIEDWE
jgi:hypothetical protein